MKMTFKALVILLSIVSAANACKFEDEDRIEKVLAVTGQNFYNQKDELCENLEEHSKKLYNKMAVEEVLAIHAYTENSWYRKINGVLRSPGRYSAADKALYKPLANILKEGLLKMPKYSGKVIRWADWGERTIKRLKVGKNKLMKAFTSSSKNLAFTWGSKNVKMIIKSKTGRYIGFLSQYEHEQEVLFPPYKKFKVTKKTEDGHVTVFDMTEL